MKAARFGTPCTTHVATVTDPSRGSHTAPGVSNERLSYPATYWNALGLLASLGIVLSFHLAFSLGERRPAPISAAAVLPCSRRPSSSLSREGRSPPVRSASCCTSPSLARKGLLSGALATVPATVVLVVVAYHANLLDTVNPTTPAAASQGHRDALVAGICAAVCAGLRLLPPSAWTRVCAVPQAGLG
jgi:hypothetical protein